MSGAAAAPEGPRFLAVPDLAGARVGGRVVAVSDEFFAPAERLLSPAEPVFDPDRYTDRGKWMDGWESRRRRGPGHDWAVVQLGAPAVVRGVDIDTRHFRGNHPDRAALEACLLEGDEARLPDDPPWTTLVPESPLAPDSPNLFPVSHPGRWTHVRLRIHPDGGVARLRVYGQARPDWAAVTAAGEPVDLAALVHGGLVLDSSDAFFSVPSNLLMPGRSVGMMDGWETRRRRGPGHDWVVIRLGAPGGRVAALEIDTHHFKGNFPESCSVDALDAPAATAEDVVAGRIPWTEILPRTTLSADREHRFEPPALLAAPASHVRLNIYPDGGVSRLRVMGFPRLTEAGA